jgi:hypothetical protein
MRGEVLVGPERRRRWSEDEKTRIIEESLRPTSRSWPGMLFALMPALPAANH